MNILEELKFYCETQNPVGALMLSGNGDVEKHILSKKLCRKTLSIHV